MTPSQLEHLKRIDAHLERLLDIASKRTPGEWKFTYEGIYNRGASFPDIIDPGEFAASDAEVSIEDATFISSCVGNAEAGWRATKAAIAALSKIAEEREPVEHGDCGNGPYVSMFRTSAARFAEQELESILAAFPLETLIP
jgi:hypothetical protein